MRPLTEAWSGLSTGALGIWIFMEWADVILLKPVVGVPELKREMKTMGLEWSRS